MSAAAHRRSSPTPGRVLAVLAAGGFANFSLIYFVQPLLPDLSAWFRAPEAAAGLALSATTAAMMVGLLLAGPLSDRFGRRRLIAGSLLFAGALTAAGAVMPTWELFLAARAASGLTLAALPAVALAYVRDSMPAGIHLRANAIYIAGTAVGGAAGRLLPLPLATLGGWQTAALALGGVGVVAGVLSAIALPVDAPRRVRLRLADLAVGTISSFADRTVLGLCVVGMIGMGVFVTVYNAISFRLQDPPFSLGHTEAFVYFAYLPGIAAPAVFRAVAERWGRGAAVTVGLAAMAAAVGILLIPRVEAIVAGLALLTIALLGTHSILSGWVVDTAHRAGRSTARASSAYLLAFYLGSTIAGTTSTVVWASGGWTSVTILGLVLVAVGALVIGTRSLSRMGRAH